MAEICSPDSAQARSGLRRPDLPSLTPAVQALLVQCFAVLVVLAIAAVWPQSFGIFYWAVLQGILAALTGRYIGMAYWWTVIHLVFVPALVLALTLTVSPAWFLGMFLLLVLVYGKTYQTQVPLYLSSHVAVSSLASILPQKQGFRFMDLGSGCGGLLFHLARVRPDGEYHGVETAPLPYLASLFRNAVNACGCHIHRESFWDHDLAAYDVVYAYLSPVPMEKLWHKARQEMKPGSMFVSNSFTVPGREYDCIVRSPGAGDSPLYIWYL